MATLKIIRANNPLDLEEKVNKFAKENRIVKCPIQAISEQDEPGFETVFYAYVWYEPRPAYMNKNGLSEVSKA